MIFYKLSSPFSFRNSLFIKRHCVSLNSCSYYVQNVNFGKHIWIHTSKNYVCIYSFWNFIPGWSVIRLFHFFSSQDEISSPQKRVNSKTWFPPRRWAPSPTCVAGDKFGGVYWRFIAQPSSLAMIRAIKKFWYLSPKFIAQPHELSFMSEKM